MAEAGLGFPYEYPNLIWIRILLIQLRPNEVFKAKLKPVLGLGDIGPEAALPVMEGKAMLLKEFGGVDAWPICLDTKDPDKIIEIVKGISPGFGGIILEDISAPRCFYIERILKEELDIPVFHDDQHGTAIVVLAALINSLKIIRKKPNNIKVVILGVGAAGTACAQILLEYGISEIVGFDRKGALSRRRDYGINKSKKWFSENTNPDMVSQLTSSSNVPSPAGIKLPLNENPKTTPVLAETVNP